MYRSVVEVVRNPLGWWDVRAEDGHVEARYLSEVQAWEAGRALAAHREADLIIHEEHGPSRYEAYDRSTHTVRPIHDILAEAPSATPAATPAKNPSILLVEDGLDARELYEEYLKFAGFRVSTAVNGQEAVTLARALRPDLIVMDLRMPGMDGIQATTALKADPALSHIPIVAVTADASDLTMQSARDAGCAAFLTKPLLPVDLAACITQVLAGGPRISQNTSR